MECLASESAVVVFRVSSRCMCHTVKRELEHCLARLMLVGAMHRVMNAHINGFLVPLLKVVGTLWL